MSLKIDRLNNIIMREVSMILEREVKDRGIEFVTVTAVKTTSDLSFSKIYVTVLNKEHTKETLKSLNGAKGFIRNVLKDRMDIRKIFFYSCS